LSEDHIVAVVVVVVVVVRGRNGYDETGSRYAEEMQREEQQGIKKDEEREGEKRRGKEERLGQGIGPTSTIAIQVYRGIQYTMALEAPLLKVIVRNNTGRVVNEEMP
jgi:hypothetical protein